MTAIGDRPDTSYEPAWPIDQLVPAPDNPRRNLGDLTELAESIASVGLIEPLLVTTTETTADTGQLLVVAGHRRLAASQRAGLTDVPVTVRQRLDDKTRREIMLIENVQRTDLLPIEEARTYKGLLDLGYSQRELAKRLGIAQSTISKRLELLEFEAAAPKLADRVGVVALTTRKGGKRDATGISLENAKELLKLRDEPGEIEKVVAKAKDPEDIPQLVIQRQKELEGERKVALWKDEAEKKRWPILPFNRYNGYLPDGTKKISTGAQYEYGDVLKVPMANHRKQPCHAVVISPGNGYNAPSRTEVCTDPASHKAKGASPLKVTPEPRRKKAPHEEKAAAEARAEKAAAEARAKKEASARREEVLVDLVARKPSRDEALALMAEWILDHCGSDVAKVAAGLLGIDNGGYRADLRDKARAAGDELRYAFAVVLSSGHFNARQTWRRWDSASVTGLYDHLLKHGYALNDFEAQELGRASAQGKAEADDELEELAQERARVVELLQQSETEQWRKDAIAQALSSSDWEALEEAELNGVELPEWQEQALPIEGTLGVEDLEKLRARVIAWICSGRELDEPERAAISEQVASWERDYLEMEAERIPADWQPEELPTDRSPARDRTTDFAHQAEIA